MVKEKMIKKTYRLQKPQLKLLDDLVKLGVCSNETEAVRRSITSGARELLSTVNFGKEEK